MQKPVLLSVTGKYQSNVVVHVTFDTNNQVQVTQKNCMWSPFAWAKIVVGDASNISGDFAQ